jgi:hypothetical protein
MEEKNQWMDQLDPDLKEFLMVLDKEGITANPEYWLNISEEEKQGWMPQIQSKEIM